ncbi:MAG: alpha/beta fold hydrolase [Hyphomicrobiales bacterium]|nr:alpha/beta fold hydrolase [Hyphomicrobiales bacterium]
MGAWKTFLIVVAGGYAVLVALMYFAQRALMYFPETARTPPADAGLTEAAEETLETADGVRVIVWHIPPRGERPVWLYFHGNGGSLRYRLERFRALTARGEGLVALSYRGYGGSGGRPSEAGLIADARAAYDFAVKRYDPGRIVLWGESLGSGVALALAVERPVARIVLEAPFVSAVDVAAGVYPFLPVRWLMKDQFRSDLRVVKVTVPILILHGDRDPVVPIASGRRLYELITAPKRFVRIAGGGHEDLGSHGVVDIARQFMTEPP